MDVGLRVVRNPYWLWNDMDGGEGCVGTVVAIGRQGTASVYWDVRGNEVNHRIGFKSSYDLRIIDNAPVGVEHPGIDCNSCRRGIAGLRFVCSQCDAYDLCLFCYMDDKHDKRHSFIRHDSPIASPVMLSPREGCEKKVLQGIFPGAKVSRGRDWEWGTEDGGLKSGRVLDFKGEEHKILCSLVNVEWWDGSTSFYRMGHDGKVDLKCEKPASPGTYYPEHLPILGKETDNSGGAFWPELLPFPHISIGEYVKVAVKDLGALKRMQEGHGDWNDRMEKIVGVRGRVHCVTDEGNIRVYYPRLNSCLTVNPHTLIKVPLHVRVGDRIRVSSALDIAAGHAKWIREHSPILGKDGTVTKVYGDGNLRVLVDGQTWPLDHLAVYSLGDDLGSKNQRDLTPSQPTHSAEERAKRTGHWMTAECLVCSVMSPKNVLLKPCGHRVACEDCSSRMKKCLFCQELISRRVGRDGKTITYEPRRPSAEALRILEKKIAKFEEVHSCGICMERQRNVVFLCGHSACDKCSAELSVCHMCRTTIAKKIHVYV